jgi:Lipase (class 3)
VKITSDLAKLLLPYAEACARTYDGSAKPTWQDEYKTVHSFLSTTPDGKPLITQEGTQSRLEWAIDGFAAPVLFPGHWEFGPLHAGFMRDALSVVDMIAHYLASQGWPEYDLGGHSKGGGEAPLIGALLKQRGHPPRRIVIFEPPRCGTWLLRKYLADVEIHGTEDINLSGPDAVTKVPPGPLYEDVTDLLELNVPETDDIATKHRIPAVIGALEGAIP